MTQGVGAWFLRPSLSHGGGSGVRVCVSVGVGVCMGTRVYLFNALSEYRQNSGHTLYQLTRAICMTSSVILCRDTYTNTHLPIVHHNSGSDLPVGSHLPRKETKSLLSMMPACTGLFPVPVGIDSRQP